MFRTRWTFVCLVISVAWVGSVFGKGPQPFINTTTPYLIYYGGWNSTQVDFARRNYRFVILDAHNISASQVTTIKRGPDNISGTADDVLVFAYVSVGEDNRPGAPVTGDGLGPRIDPRSSDSVPLSSITNALGLPSPGGTGYASYYLDTKGSADGVPDKNPTYGGCYVNAGAPAWWATLKSMTIATDGNAGLDEVLTTSVGKALNCDGVFLDTIDTAAPNSFGGTTYEWTAPGMQTLLQRLSTNYPSKFIIANRGLFFYDPNFKQFAYTLRPYINVLMFESYFTDSSSSDQTNPFFADNKYDYAPKLNAEAARPDGFSIIALGYDHSPPLPQNIINQDYVESMGIQGWPLYRTDPSLTSPFNTNASAWLATNADTQPPVWDSTAAQSGVPPSPRVGVQQVVAGDDKVTVRWDVARDQTGPVHYNIYFTNQSAFTFATAIKLTNVSPAMPSNYASGTGPGVYPFEYTIAGLTNGVSYTFAVRAQDSAVPAHEDSNIVTLSAIAGTNVVGGTYRNITIDGDFSDWANVPVAYHGPVDGNPMNFADVQFANDANYLYGHFTLHSAAAPFSDFNTHFFVDRDDNALTGYQPTGASFGSEMMIEGSTGYDQRNGGWNEGTVSGVNWMLAPSGSATEFEFRCSLAAFYSGGAPVFNQDNIRLLLQDNRGNEVSGDTGIPYVLASAPSGTYAHITVDGDTSDWAGVPTLATAPPTNTPVSFATLSAANDNDYLYLRFTLHAPGAPFSDFNTHVFIDTDNNGATGYHPTGLSIGSELLIESGAGYDERNGGFNDGTVSGLDWELSPAGSGTNFEVRISRQAQYNDGSPVFSGSTIRFLLQDNRGSILIPQGVSYTFAGGGPYEDWRAQYFTAAELADPAISGDDADPDGDGIPNLVEFAFNLNPRVASRSNLPRAFIDTEGGQTYLYIQYIERNSPAGVQYVLQSSSDLISWDSNPGNFTQVDSSDNGDGTSWITARLQTPLLNSARMFVRVAIQR